MKLGKRLSALSALVDKDSRVADIGTDHGYLSADLFESQKCKAVYASDLNKDPLDAARATLAEHGYEKHVILRLGPGFEPYGADEIDSAVIAGMGGNLIASIIDEHIDLAKSLKYMILQPMQDPDVLRHYLLTHGFEIVTEQIVQEGRKFYEIMKCRAGNSQGVDVIKNEIGYAVEKSPAHKGFLAFRLKRHEMILKSLSVQDQGVYGETILEHQQFIEVIEEALHEY